MTTKWPRSGSRWREATAVLLEAMRLVQRRRLMDREIPFTQYLLPNGRTKTIHISRPEQIADKADAILAQGYRFECELLTTGDVSLTIVQDWDADDDGDVAIEVCRNSSGIPDAVDRMIERFHATLGPSHDAARCAHRPVRAAAGPGDGAVKGGDDMTDDTSAALGDARHD